MKDEFDITKLVRPNIRGLSPYRSARDDFDSGLLLDANENSCGAPFQKAEGLHRYPSPCQKELKSKIADWRGVDKKNVFTGTGSDEAIDLLIRIFCMPGRDRIITTPPTYGMYRVSANIHDIAVDEVLMNKNFEPETDRILETVTENTRLLFLCSPNNPTGNTIPESIILNLLDSFPGLIVIDEAYIDFSDSRSWCSSVVKHHNLVVLQTMSKSFGLAGIRLGMAFAPGEVISYMNKVKAPYNVNTLTEKYAIEAFNHLDTIESNIKSLKKEKNRLKNALSEIDSIRHIYPSQANFLLVRIDRAKSVYKKLAKEGVIVRYRGNEPLCENCLRITVGIPEENDMLIQTLRKVTS